MSSDCFADLDVQSMLAGFSRRDISPVEVIGACLDRIEDDPLQIGAFTTVLRDRAEASALAAERSWREGRGGALQGVPYGLKDMIATAGVTSTNGSSVYSWTPSFDAAVEERLRGAGAVLVGKLAMTELAYPVHASAGSVRNPYRPELSPGGSSSGSAAAVAARQVPLAIGSDTGGSIRIPASHCGVVGLKPTYGRISRFGAMGLSWSLDHLGPIAHSVGDCASAYAVLAGADVRDPLSLTDCSNLAGARSHGQDVANGRDVSTLRVVMPTGWPVEVCDEATRASLQVAAERLRGDGVTVLEIEFPLAHHAPGVGVGILHAEMASLHRGLSPEDSRLGPSLREALRSGRDMSAAHYLDLLRFRRVLQHDVAKGLSEADALLWPGATALPPSLRDAETAAGDGAGASERSWVEATSIFNVTGMPSIAVPSTLYDGIPIGVQVVAEPLHEARCFEIAGLLEAHFAAPVPPGIGEP